MASQTLLRSLNWRFYSILIIMTLTVFIFVYNTFIINEINGNQRTPPQLAIDVFEQYKLRQLQNLQQKNKNAFDKELIQQQDEPDAMESESNYNAPRTNNNDILQLKVKEEEKKEEEKEENKNIIYHSDGYIIGNPLLQNECKNAIINTMPDKLLSYFPNLLKNTIQKHWFISRESYSTLFSHSHREQHYKTHSKRKPLTYFSKTKVQTPIKKGFNNTKTTSYFNIEKSASSTTTTYLKRQPNNNTFEQNIIDSNTLVISNCSFTFVRDPLQRFVSAYYTVNRLMWDVENHPERVNDHEHIANLRHIFKFLSVKGEPDRFRAFVDDLSVFESLFIFGSRHLQHMMSQTAILSLADLSQIGTNIEWFTNPESGNNNNRFFIGRVEQYEEHWKKLSTICEDIVMYESDLQLMPSYGARESLNKTYLKVMSLDDWKKGDTLPAYNAIDDVTFAKIVNFYYQDYVCFGYEPKLPDFDKKKTKK